MKKILLLCIIFLAIGTPAQSAVIEHTVNVTNNAYYDTINKLVWMDVDHYLNMTYAEVESSLNSGFSIATKVQVEEMVESAGNNYDAIADIMGDTYVGGEREAIIYGWLNDPDAESGYKGMAWRYKNKLNGSPDTDDWNFNYFDEDGAQDHLGAFVVQTVPVPSTLLLLGFGLVGMGVLGRKKFKK